MPDLAMGDARAPLSALATGLDGVLVVTPSVHQDRRGYFFESWNADRYRAIGLPDVFVQDNISRSSRGTLRGLHLQEPYGQGKLIQVLDGEIFDVAVDVRVGSPTFARWVGVELSSTNHRQFYVPAGFAHGFRVLSDTALVNYKCTAVYHPETELAIRWCDSAIGVVWPGTNPILSSKDAAASLLHDIDSARLPRYESPAPGMPR
jgi:dTDP-4-dehydrorhamnose 3,5-epimerase